MQTFNEPFLASNHETATEETTPVNWVPDLAERLETLERANLALERARELLERVHRPESSRAEVP